MKSLAQFMFFLCTFGMLLMLSKAVSDTDPTLFQPPSADQPHHVQRRILEEEDDPFIGDPTIRFFLRMLLSPFSIFTPKRKIHHHAPELNAGLFRNSTEPKTIKSEIQKSNRTEKSDKNFVKLESKPKRSDEFRTAHRKHFRFDAFPFLFHRPVAERSGPVIDIDVRETADGVSTEKHNGKHETLKTGSSAHGKNTTNINFFNRRYAFIWSIEWRSLMMHIILVMVFSLIITLALLFCHTVFTRDVKKVKLHPDKFSLSKNDKFVTKQEAKNVC